ncbi:uncharacterized protein LOC134541447 isoform X2 [Bacillus rossius redtenbacheri]
MLWHVASLGGFPLDYELLYCGYAALGALAEAAVRRGGGGRGGGLGAALLAAHFGAGAALGPAWWSLAVAPLAGAGSALLRPDEDDAVRPAPRDLGHALGCLAGGALAHGLGTAALFRACAAASCAWCVVSVACRGLRRCHRGRPYTHVLLTTPDERDSPAESDDWLERALIQEERREGQIPTARADSSPSSSDSDS